MNSNVKILNKISALRIWHHTKRIIYQDLKCKDSSTLQTHWSHIATEKNNILIIFTGAGKGIG